MRYISFAWTTPALLAGRKTVTRRQWRDRHAAGFKAGDRVQAFDKNPLYGGKRVAIIELLSVTKEPISKMPDSDFEAEGFAYLEEKGIAPPKGMPVIAFTREGFELWRASGQTVWVLRFKVVEISDAGT